MAVGMVDNTQENIWPSWYRQRVEVLWTTLNQYHNTGLTMQDKRILFRTRSACRRCSKVLTTTVCWCTATSTCAVC
jgi:hypothetical protein